MLLVKKFSWPTNKTFSVISFNVFVLKLNLKISGIFQKHEIIIVCLLHIIIIHWVWMYYKEMVWRFLDTLIVMVLTYIVHNLLLLILFLILILIKPWIKNRKNQKVRNFISNVLFEFQIFSIVSVFSPFILLVCYYLAIILFKIAILKSFYAVVYIIKHFGRINYLTTAPIQPVQLSSSNRGFRPLILAPIPPIDNKEKQKKDFVPLFGYLLITCCGTSAYHISLHLKLWLF